MIEFKMNQFSYYRRKLFNLWYDWFFEARFKSALAKKKRKLASV